MILSALPYTTTLLATMNSSFKCFHSIQLTTSYFILGCRFKDVRRNLHKDIVAACLLLQLSDAMEPQEAIESLRDLRGSGAIQTIKQYNYLHDFRENLAAHLSTKDAILRSVSR
uniref:Uncharacterized protein n=1 Tax=Gopherus evgoodei TaxID=1825980 RepID=A0A8C4VHZ9_9SAUR